MSAARTGSVTAPDGVAIAWRVDGPEDAPWLILSNSLATDRSMWDAQVEALAERRRVLRYDTRGHGRSGPGAAPYSFDLLSGDVLALYDAHGIEAADVIGLSLGGMTGLALAMRAPERVRRLVCCDARADAPPPYRAIWDTNIARLHEGGVEALVQTTLGRWFTESYRAAPENAATLDRVRTMIRGTSNTGYEGAARALQSLDLLGGLGDLQCPVLYVVGEDDMAAPADVMQDMADRTPGASLTVLPNAAHLSNIEQPRAFLQAVRGFLDL